MPDRKCFWFLVLAISSVLFSSFLVSNIRSNVCGIKYKYVLVETEYEKFYFSLETLLCTELLQSSQTYDASTFH